MRRRLARLGLSLEHKEKLRRARLGTTQTEETRRKISETMRGRKHTPQALENMRTAALMKKDPLAECVAVRKARKNFCDKLRTDAWKLDLVRALERKDAALFFDIQQSGGWYFMRKRFHPACTDGVRGWWLRQAFYESAKGVALCGKPPPRPKRLQRALRGAHRDERTTVRLHVEVHECPTYAAILRDRERVVRESAEEVLRGQS